MSERGLSSNQESADAPLHYINPDTGYRFAVAPYAPNIAAARNLGLNPATAADGDRAAAIMLATPPEDRA